MYIIAIIEGVAEVRRYVRSNFGQHRCWCGHQLYLRRAKRVSPVLRSKSLHLVLFEESALLLKEVDREFDDIKKGMLLEVLKNKNT